LPDASKDASARFLSLDQERSMHPATATVTPSIVLIDGKATTTSTEVARIFGKQHKEVLRAIETLVAQLPADPLRNFAQGVYTLPETGDQQHRMFTLTRDGFTLLAMGFTGKRALQFKLAYIAAFNAMEQQLHSNNTVSVASILRNRRLLIAFDENGTESVQVVPFNACIVDPSTLQGVRRFVGEMLPERLIPYANDAINQRMTRLIHDLARIKQTGRATA
jgi:Rha family phage regulatory protein